MRLLGSAVWAAAAVATAAACSFSAGTSVSVDKDAVGKEISANLEKQVGRVPESVECPENLEGKVGVTMRCTLSDSGETYGVTVTVTKVEGADVKFDIAVDDEPQ